MTVARKNNGREGDLKREKGGRKKSVAFRFLCHPAEFQQILWESTS
jgi:hypothetical protein